ncbi:MAG: hypothetical protein M0P74_15065 [Syntrophales bacterium]|jgi:hypothetical protein|nr:hypothetical protein [Syntrophales bacterium]
MRALVSKIRRRDLPKNFPTTFLLVLLAACGVNWLVPYPASGQTRPVLYKQAPALIDLRTTFSDGVFDPEALAALAVQKGIKIIILNDHDRMVIEYGLPPFRNILKKREERNSINQAGAKAYLAAVERARKKYPQAVIIPGAESAPFYYWTGSFLDGSLTANDHERRILTIGLEKPEDYQTLAVIHRESALFGYKTTILAMAVFAILLLLAVYLFFKKNGRRSAGLLLLAVDLILVAAFSVILGRSSPFDAYHGPQGAVPYQRFLDDAGRKGALTFWNYPETQSGIRKMGPIQVNTRPYPQMLMETNNYTGFSAIYGDNVTITEPGEMWDMVLREYCGGFRRTPPWGIATSDYHREGESGQKLGDFQTVLLLPELSRNAVIDALRKGRMYACQGKFPKMPRLDVFTVSPSALSESSVPPAVSGETLRLKRNPRISIQVSGAPDAKETVQVRLIRSGELVQVFSGTLPLKADYVDNIEKPAGQEIFYRLDVKGYGKIVSNPIFVSFVK